jgi:hypothetical protein
MQFIEESWKAAFRLLSEDAESKNYGVKIKDIESWNASKISVLNEKSSQIFNTIAGGADVSQVLSRKPTIKPLEVSSLGVKSTKLRPK